MRLLYILFVSLLIIGTCCFFKKYALYQHKIRIGVNAYSGAEHFNIADEESVFNHAGLRVKIVDFGSIEDVKQAFEWKQIDAMVCPLIDAIITHQKEICSDSKIILIPSYPNNKNPCCLIADKKIQNLKELKGKSIGIEVNSFGHYFLNKGLASVGLTQEDITLISMDPTATTTFLTNNKVDAVVTYAPFLNFSAKKFYHTIYSTKNWPKEFLLNVFLVRNQILNNFREGLITFLRQWDNIIQLSYSKREYCRHLLSLHHAISNEESDRLLNSIVPLKLENQLPLFLHNNSLYGIISSTYEYLLHKKISIETIENIWDSLFDISFFKAVSKK